MPAFTIATLPALGPSLVTVPIPDLGLGADGITVHLQTVLLSTTTGATVGPARALTILGTDA